jgi:hypothetical protein
MKPANLLSAVACATACLLSSCDTATGYVRQLEQSSQGTPQSSPGTPNQKTAEPAPSATTTNHSTAASSEPSAAKTAEPAPSVTTARNNSTASPSEPPAAQTAERAPSGTNVTQTATSPSSPAKVNARSIETITVNSTGFGPNEDAAVRDACNNAVKEAFGFLLDGKSVLKNGELTEDIKSLSSGIVDKYIVNRRSSEGQLIKAEITAVVKKGGLYQALEATKVSKRGVDGKALGNAISQEIAREAAFVEIYTRIIGEYLPYAISVEIPDGCTEIVDKTAVAIRVSVKVTPNKQARDIFKERFALLLDQAAQKRQRLSISHDRRTKNNASLIRALIRDDDSVVGTTAAMHAFPFTTESLVDNNVFGTCPKQSLLGQEAIAFARCLDSRVCFESNGSNNRLPDESVVILDDDGKDGTVYLLSGSMYKSAKAAYRKSWTSLVLLVEAVDDKNKTIASGRITQSDPRENAENASFLCGHDFKTLAPGFLLPSCEKNTEILPFDTLQVCTTIRISPADISRLHAFHVSVIPSAKK